MKNKVYFTIVFFIIMITLSACGGKNSSGNNEPIRHEHSYEWVIIEEANCLKTGFKQQKCNECGDVLTTSIIQKTYHTVIIDKAINPTCTETGLTEGSHCSICNEKIIEQTILPAIGHSYLYSEELSNNHINVYVCQNCKHKYEVENNGKTCLDGHNSSDWIITKEATCSEFGSKHKVCLNCDLELAIELIAVKDHEETILYKEEPTCTETGLTEGKKCSICNKTIVAQNLIDALGHEYEIINVVEPTESQKGYVEYKCVRCNDKYQVELDDTDNYNPSKPTSIELSDNGIIVKNNNGGVIINNSHVTITTSGEYEINGTLSNGTINIESDSESIIEIKLINVNISSTTNHPIYIASANEVDISAKEGTKNYINDNRTLANAEDVGAAIYSKADLTLKGHGELYIKSSYNNGIGGTKDLKIKNLTLEVNAPNNAIKGNDSLTIESGNIKAISSTGDALKTENSDISDKGNQRGNITIEDGTINLYAAFDGIDASHDVIINGGTINIYTEQFSEYSGDVSIVDNKKMYIRVSRNTGISNYNYPYSAMFILNDDSTSWVKGSYINDRQSKYVVFDMPKNAKYVKFYAYSTSQSPNQGTSYLYATDQLTVPTAYDTYYITSLSGNRLNGNWQNYNVQGGMGGPGGPGGGMQEGNPNSSTYSCKGIKGDNSIIINNGKINIKSHDDAIHTNTDVLLENGKYGVGDLTINGGVISLYSNDDAIHSDGILTINGGNIIISGSYEGIEGNLIYFKEGTTQIKSLDDAINAKSTLYFQGGIVYLDAGGDGIDSNGNIYMSGGVVLALGPSNGGNGVIDYGDRGYTFQFSGGLLLAIGCSGMNAKPTATSGNTVVASTKSASLNSYLNITSNGKVLAVLKVTKSNQSYCVLAYNNNSYPSSVVNITTSNSYTLVNGLYYIA